MAVRSGLLVFFVWAAAVSCQFEKAASTSNGVNTCSCEPTCSASGTATYKVTFNFEWPSDNYPRPQNFPHWSPPVLATHSSCAVVWRNGLTATSGTEQLAEFGRTSTINTEIRGLGDSVRETRTLSSVSTAAGTATTDLKADQFRHSLTALSMIAPSSDWFVGVDSVPLCVNNSWIQSATHNLYPWDAGSDDRNTYNFGGVSTNTNPRENITRIRTSNYPQAFVPSGVDTVPMGTLDISRISMDTAVAATPQAQCSKCSGTCTRSYDIIPGTQASSPTASTVSPTFGSTTSDLPVATSRSATTSANTVPVRISPTFGSTTSDLPVATSRSTTTSANAVPVRNMTMLGSGNGSGSDRLTISTTAFTTVLSLLSLGLANLLV